MSRIPLPTPDTMTPAQLQVYEKIVSGPRKRLVGPLRAALHNPELADRWQQLGALLRFGTSLSPRLNELAILVTARRWNSQIEWHIHGEAALKAGLPQTVLDAIRNGSTPEFDDADDALVYAFARQLQSHGDVDAALYARAVERFQPVGVVELTAVVGYYTMVSMTLNVHAIPMPDDIPPPLEVPMAEGRAQLSALPPAAIEMPAPSNTAIPPSMQSQAPSQAQRNAPAHTEMQASYIPDTVETPRMPQAPKQALPPNACDTHCHVFGPYDQFPLHHRASYASPDAPATRYRTMLHTIGAARGVLVQPAPYGTDASAILDALAADPRALRGIAVATPDIDDAALKRLRDAGVMGLRFVEARDPAGNLFAGSVGFEHVDALAPRLRALGMHAQLWSPCDAYLQHLPRLAQLGIPIVLDHMASLVPSRGRDDPARALVRQLLADGRVWVKLTTCRVPQDDQEQNGVRALHDELLAANEDQVLWGSDWPFVRMGARAPDVGTLIDTAHAWLATDARRRKVWTDNPARLYGFDN